MSLIRSGQQWCTSDAVEFTRFVWRWAVELRQQSRSSEGTDSRLRLRRAYCASSARAFVQERCHRKAQTGSRCGWGAHPPAVRDPARRCAGSRIRVPPSCGFAAGARSCSLGQRSSTLPAMKRRASEPRPLSGNVVGNAAHSSSGSNPSIEGTSTSKLRLLAAAPHVKR